MSIYHQYIYRMGQNICSQLPIQREPHSVQLQNPSIKQQRLPPKYSIASKNSQVFPVKLDNPPQKFEISQTYKYQPQKYQLSKMSTAEQILTIRNQDQPSPAFATKAELFNFVVSADVEFRVIQLKTFVYPQGSDIPRGQLIKEPYILKNGAMYAGEWKNGKMHGRGMFVLPNKSILTCIVKENIIFGRARIIYPNGDYFQGEIENNKANGKGKLVEGKIIYQGGFKDNQLHGKGIQTCDEYVFQGEFYKSSKKQGVLAWKTDNFTNTYRGSFENDLFHGRGTLTTKQGKYIGQFKKGVKSGFGKYYYKNHRYYEGQFQNDWRHGFGKIVDLNDSMSILEGMWEQDNFVEK